MGYKRKELQILGGGFNLLPPGDKVPKTDYLLAQNWRVDRLGRLVSRYGYPLKFSITGGGLAHSAGIHGGINGDYYVGVNDVITPTPAGRLFSSTNAYAAAIATGFDGNRIALCPMNSWMWVMNRGKQGRHKGGGTFETWNIAAPVSGCSAAAVATPGTVGSATYTYSLQSNPDYIHYLTVAGVTYQFAENGYSAGQLPLVIASLASADPNVTVEFPGSGANVTITPRIANILIAVSGSDANSPASLANGAISTLPNGTYTYYVTYESADQSLESNPSPVSNAVTVSSSAVALTSVPVSADSRTGRRNIYASGGNLGQPYLVGAINDNSSTSITISIPDLEATNNGVVMPTDHDGPPAASGMAGPHFARLYAWSTAANVNRLFYTDPDLPQYWPGANDPAVGNWVDVGAEGESIIWCTVHGNLLVIYKERSIWMLIGDPSTGTLVCVRDGLGLSGQFAVTEAGAIDYFVGPNNLYKFDMDRVAETGGAIQPLFNASSTNTGPITPPGSILYGTAYNATNIYPYAVSLGYSMGKLYIGYAEQGSATQYCLLVYHEESDRWFYHRNMISGATAWFGFLFDGQVMVGLTGSVGGAAKGYNLDDFRSFFTQDPGPVTIDCYYQSHYEDCGLPDNQKNWLDLVIDYEFAGSDTASVYVGYDGGATALAPIGGALAGTGRKTASYPIGTDGKLAKSISVAITASANSLLIIHNIYLYYYEEARIANAASTIPTDLGSPKVKQCKELQLDIDASGGAVSVNLYSDLPGNALAVRQTPTVAMNAGRAVMKYPFSVTEGFLWRLALTGFNFRLYSARLLMRPIGTYVEAYEAAAGFVWDSMELTFDSGITHVPRGYQISLASLPIKRAREISLQIDTFNLNVTITLLSDLPGNAMTSRFTATINSGTAGRRFVRIPLPAGTNAPIEGRMFRLQISGINKFVLYEAAIELLAIGVYVEAYEAAAGAVYDSRELDFGTPGVKECRELELDIETDLGFSVSAAVIPDFGTQVTTGVNTTGRQKVMVPLTSSAAGEVFMDGRFFRLLITGTRGFRLYGARFRVRPYGQYLLAVEGAAGALWDTTDLDLGTQTVKQLRELELDIWAYGSYTVAIYTDLPGNAMVARVTVSFVATTGRTKVQIPLPQGQVPDNYLFGRLVRVTVTSSANIKLFGARIHVRPIGLYVETYEAAGGAVWDSTPSDLGSPTDKTFDELRLECDTDGAATVSVYTDLPGEAFTSKGSFPLTFTATGRHWATVPLPAGIEGRSIRLVVSSTAGFRLYRAQVRSSRIGRYICAATPAGSDAFTSLEFDFESERVKLYKKIEIDMRADGVVNAQIITNQTGAMATAYTPILATPNGRETLSVVLPPGIRGRLLRLAMTSTGAARIYAVRVWTRPVNEPKAQWEWVDYPLEKSDVLASWGDLQVPETPAVFTWADLPVEPTKPEWVWAPCPVAPTEAQWFWGKILSVEETPETWEMIDVPFEVTG